MWKLALITFEYEWPPSIKSSNNTEFMYIRRSTVKKNLQMIPIYGIKEAPDRAIKGSDLPLSKVSSLILLGEILSKSRLRFPLPNRHWLKYRSKSHRVPHNDLYFAGLNLEADQPPQDFFDYHLSLLYCHDRNKHQHIWIRIF